MKFTSQSRAQGNEESLAGIRVLVGRTRQQASGLSAGLRELGAEVIEIPFIEIRKPESYAQLDSALRSLNEYDWLILTSVNGVEAFWERMRELQLDDKAWAHLSIAAIGPATKNSIESRGAKVQVVPRQYVAESVVESLREQVPGKRVLLARAKVARDVIPTELRKLGAQVDVVEAYETVVPEGSRLLIREVMRDAARRPNVIAFTSSSTVKNFIRLMDAECGPPSDTNQSGAITELFRGITFASIGPVTSATLRECGFPVSVEAEEYTIPGLITAITHRPTASA
jgi:uroporphyrinogen-III synthase